MNDSVVLMNGETRCWSPLGFKGSRLLHDTVLVPSVTDREWGLLLY